MIIWCEFPPSIPTNPLILNIQIPPLINSSHQFPTPAMKYQQYNKTGRTKIIPFKRRDDPYFS